MPSGFIDSLHKILRLVTQVVAHISNENILGKAVMHISFPSFRISAYVQKKIGRFVYKNGNNVAHLGCDIYDNTGDKISLI